MTLHVYEELEQRSPEWYAARAGNITASAIGKLITPTLKVASNDTSRSVTTTLAAERITGHVDDFGMTPDMWRGVECEPIAREAYEAHTGVTVQEVGFIVEDGWGTNFGYSPDGLVPADGLIEIKCPRQKTHLTTLLADEVPAYNMAQCQAGLLITGRAWLDFISFCAGMPLYVKRVHPDPQWKEVLIEAARTFETNAQAIVARYGPAIEGRPPTERLPDLDDITF